MLPPLCYYCYFIKEIPWHKFFFGLTILLLTELCLAHEVIHVHLCHSYSALMTPHRTD
jgi:hypothetical protein